MTGCLRAVGRLLRILLHMLAGVRITWRLARSGADEAAHCEARRDWYARALEIAGVRFRITGALPQRPSLVVANHISWLDIPLLGAAVDPCFLAKAEIARWPLIGWLARAHGTRFIRRGAHEASEHILAMQAGLAEGRHFVVFPEGTTSRGEGVRRFHPRLFAAVAGTEYPVQPVALDYEQTRDRTVPVAYADGDRLVPNVWRLLCRPETRVDLHFLPSLDAAASDRRALADASRDAIVEVLDLPAEPLEPRSFPGRRRRPGS